MVEIESLHEKLEDAEQEINNSHKLNSQLNEKIVHYEFKQAELASLDTAVLKAKVTDLEGTITGKDHFTAQRPSTIVTKRNRKISSNSCSISSSSLRHNKHVT